ncbi:PIN domain-containing protein [bacterium]|nr:PIN domain-containing protein [bacterium]
MILLDTNVPIYASDRSSIHYRWARAQIARAVAGEGAGINAVSLAEICVGDEDPSTVADRLRSWGVEIFDVPVAAAELSARAYAQYCRRRKSGSNKDAPPVPLPDFFIGAHAAIMNWTLVTADQQRFRTYFPSVRLVTP